MEFHSGGADSSSGNQDDGMTEEERKRLLSYEDCIRPDCLKADQTELLTKCDLCDLQCDRATQLLIHVQAVHGVSPAEYATRIRFGYSNAKELESEIVCFKLVNTTTELLY